MFDVLFSASEKNISLDMQMVLFFNLYMMNATGFFYGFYFYFRNLHPGIILL